MRPPPIDTVRQLYHAVFRRCAGFRLRVAVIALGAPDEALYWRAATGRRQRLSCEKKRYASEAEAVRTAHWYRRRRGERLHAYWCGECSAWHLGHRPVQYQPRAAR